MEGSSDLEIYERLTDVLDTIPNGFVKTSDGTHLKILQWIFTPEEADLASKMKLMGETVDELSSRLNIPVEGLVDKLEVMAKKGQIRAWNSSTGRRYCLIPYAVGIYEEQLDRMDPEFAQLMEEYLDKASNESNGKGLFDSEPPIFRVIPVNRSIKTELEIHPYQQAEQMIRQAKSWGIRDCICKKQFELIGHTCDFQPVISKKVCMMFAPKEDAFGDGLTQSITMEESLKILKESEEAGLIHCSMNIQTGQSYICNCCTCCCGVLRSLTERKQPLAFVNSNYLMSVDSDLCTGCETCVDRCQFDALEVVDDICVVEEQKCVGCGVCAIVCPDEALSLVARITSDQTPPPENFRDWMEKKAISRNVDPSSLL
ncbi:MAG: ATP-binding protein [Candidatus Hodarchaeales archaeon]|jgi:ferredoxin